MDFYEGLQQVDTLEELEAMITARDVEADQSKLKSIVGWYSIPEKTRCELKNCHQSHNTGYLVRMADDGLTKLGNTCGRKFGKQFSDELRRVRAIRTRGDTLKTIAAWCERKDAVLSEINDLLEKKGGAKSLNNAVKFLRDQLPELVRQKIRDMVRRGDTAVYVVQELSYEQRKAKADTHGGAPDNYRYESVQVGNFRGLEIFREGTGSLKELLIDRVQSRLTSLDLDALKQLSSPALNQLSKSLAEIEPALNEARKLMQAGEYFFKHQKPHSKLLLALARSDEERSILEKLQWPQL